MIVGCTSCHHEAQVVSNVDPCIECGAPMRSIGDDYMSDCDESISPHRRPMGIPENDAELSLTDLLDGTHNLLRVR